MSLNKIVQKPHIYIVLALMIIYTVVRFLLKQNKIIVNSFNENRINIQCETNTHKKLI